MHTDTRAPSAGSGAPAGSPSISTYAGIFLVSAATLLLQVTFTRIFSVSIWYHFAFLVVSIALFGFGASGVALSLVPAGPRDRIRMGIAPLLFAVTAIVAYVGTNLVPFSPFEIASEPLQVALFLVIDLLLALPFFFAGTTVVLILRSHPAHAGPLYAWDLVGAAIGTLLVFALLPIGGARGAIAGAAVLGLGSSLALAPGRGVRIASGAALLLVAPLVARPDLLPAVRIDASKPLAVEVEERGGEIEFTAWNALSRIDVVRREGIDPMILIDSAAMTSLARPIDEGSPYLRNVSTLVYRIQDAPRAVIIGTGGGMDVQNALALGAEHVTAVEINPIIIDLVTGRYREEIGDIFTDPRVTLVRDPAHADRHLGRGRLGRLQPHGELPLHDRCLPGVPRAPFPRRHALDHALVLRIAPAGDDRARGPREDGRRRAGAARPRPPAPHLDVVSREAHALHVRGGPASARLCGLDRRADPLRSDRARRELLLRDLLRAARPRGDDRRLAHAHRSRLRRQSVLLPDGAPR
jgi:hypothetical protein